MAPVATVDATKKSAGFADPVLYAIIGTPLITCAVDASDATPGVATVTGASHALPSAAVARTNSAVPTASSKNAMAGVPDTVIVAVNAPAYCVELTV